MKKIKDMGISELEAILKIWAILEKFYFIVSLILIISISLKFVLFEITMHDFLMLIIGLNLLYLPFVIQFSIKRNIDKQRIEMYLKKQHYRKR